MIPVEELIFALRRMRVQTGSLVCLGCGYEQDCSVHGCRILREAGEMVDALYQRVKNNAECEDCRHQADLAKCDDQELPRARSAERIAIAGTVATAANGSGVDVMTNEQAARILDPATSRDALAPYAQDGQMRLAVTETACRVAVEALRPWRDAGIEVPADDHDVLVLVSGQYGNITFEHAPMLGAWLGQEGWYLNEYPMWDKPSVTQWMEIPHWSEED